MRYKVLPYRHGVMLWGWKIWDTRYNRQRGDILYSSQEEADELAAILNKGNFKQW